MSNQFSDKLYIASIDIAQTVDALCLIRDALLNERNVVANDATAVMATYFCKRMDQYFSAYNMLFNRLQTIADTLEDLAEAPPVGEVIAHG